MSDLSIPYTGEPPALDIQHDTDPADDHGEARRIPHLGHAVLFLAIVAACTALCILVTQAATHTTTASAARQNLGWSLVAQAEGYVLGLCIAAWLFPRLWEKSFLEGISWNVLAACRNWRWLIPSAIVLSVTAQVALRFLSVPKDAPIEHIFDSQHIAYLVACMGVLLGPLMEEIVFRGFLLPALATAYDWLTFPRTPAGFERWQNSTAHTTPALVVAALVSSAPFALMHAAQIGYAWGVVAILYGVSLALSYVRIRTHSVACSALMHATYNFVLFAMVFIASSGFRHLERLQR